MSEKGRISADQLSERLVGARKLMTKVDTGDFKKGAISENMIQAPEGELLAAPIGGVPGAPPEPAVNPNLHKAPPQASERQIRESKLPDAIKQAMIENPITQIGLNDSLDMNFVEKTKRLMEEEGVMTKVTNGTAQQPSAPVTAPAKAPVTESKSVKLNMSDLERRLTPIIENIIRKTLDEIVDKKLNTILAASQGQSINENLAIKVGETLFTGKLTKAKSTK